MAAASLPDRYCQQLDRVAEKLKGKQDRIYFLHGNARFHVAKSTRQKLLDLEWTTVSYPSYSSNRAPADYHLYRSLFNRLHEKEFYDEKDLETDLPDFFDEKPQTFYEHEILSLPEGWRQVIDSNEEKR